MNTVRPIGGMTTREFLICMLYLPIHVFGLPAVGAMLYDRGILTLSQVNLYIYAIGAVFMLAFLWDFFKREFYVFCDRPGFCIVIIGASYLIMLGFNMVVSSVLFSVAGDMNPNTQAVADLAQLDMRTTAAMSIFMAPILEEPIFRGAIFGAIRPKSRYLAYGVSMLLFAVYHVWGYALADPIMWVYVIQYLPVSFLLCQCYERTGSIWTSVFFHMLVNGISIGLQSVLGELI